MYHDLHLDKDNYMKQITQKEIEDIFASTDFRISFSTSESFNLRYCNI